MSKQIPEELVPPMQNPPGAVFRANGMQFPFFQFVTIRRAEGLNLEIWSSSPALQSPAHSEETYVENVVQTYSVQIPYSETVDGKSFTKFRTEHRTRSVPITKFLPKTDTPREDLIEETYTVSVPYTEHLDGGTSTVTRTRLESRTRLIDPNEVPQEVTSRTDFVLEPLANVTFFDLTGNHISPDIAFDDSTCSTAAIQIASAEHIADYFSQILAIDAVFFVVSRAPANPKAVDS